MNVSADELALRNAVQRMCRQEPVVRRAIVACSGGPDSIALAATAAWVAGHDGPSMQAVIIDHRVQSDSAAVSAQGAEACRTLGLPADVVAVSVGTEGGFEAAARRARYAALTEAARTHGADAVLLGHTRDDQAETVLLRLIRGSGARALAAMRPINGIWRRPFLPHAREQVHRVAEEVSRRTSVPIWQDPHNADAAFARVQVRQLLAGWSMGGSAALGLARTAALLADDADFLDALADEAIDACAENDELLVDALGELPRALRTRVLRSWLIGQGCPAGDLDFEHVVGVEALITEWHGQGPLTLPGSVCIERAYGRLRAVQTIEES